MNSFVAIVVLSCLAAVSTAYPKDQSDLVDELISEADGDNGRMDLVQFLREMELESLLASAQEMSEEQDASGSKL